MRTVLSAALTLTYEPSVDRRLADGKLQAILSVLWTATHELAWQIILVAMGRTESEFFVFKGMERFGDWSMDGIFRNIRVSSDRNNPINVMLSEHDVWVVGNRRAWQMSKLREKLV
jgi:hypothetical protein